ncbi:ribosome maturation factor RimP [Arcanobacterium haemolyticum]|nr:ribosome maturation factor RimP [Arcanobacterium haemolyticum]
MARTSQRPKENKRSNRPQTSRQRQDFSEIQKRITEAITPVVDEAHLYLEEVRAGRRSGGVVVKVVVDLPSGPGGVDSDTLTELSRSLAKVLDDVDLVEGAYNLEVSTPGAERLLTQPRHFSRAEGRLVAFRMADGTAFTARVKASSEISVDVAQSEGVRTIALDDIASARVQIEFGHPDPEDEA